MEMFHVAIGAERPLLKPLPAPATQLRQRHSYVPRAFSATVALPLGFVYIPRSLSPKGRSYVIQPPR